MSDLIDSYLLWQHGKARQELDTLALNDELDTDNIRILRLRAERAEAMRLNRVSGPRVLSNRSDFHRDFFSQFWQIHPIPS